MAKYVPPFKKEKANQELFWSEPALTASDASAASNRWARDSNFKARTNSFDSRSEPKATSFEPRATSFEPKGPYEPRSNQYEKRSSIFEPRGSFEPRATSFEPKGTYEPRATSFEPKAPYDPKAHQVKHLEQQVNKMQLDDFPSLPQKKPQPQQSQQQPKGRMTYASLAANWAEQVKENEEKAKKAAEEEEEKRRLQAKLNEVKIVKVSKGVIPKTRTDSDDDKECDIGCHVSDNSSYSDGPDNYDVDADAESEEEEEEEDPDAFWTQRKNRNELY